ncbi:hypothetical protein ACFV0C_02410 [Streptomyces sp. NPDC059568]|uniref:acyl-CoA-like ligand-binding transcription factor n=1 Tax=Streptomyces sp. NPDC059568 TaxID=3346868 RepID=UPI00367EFEDC
MRARPSGEDDWTALRRALDAIVEYHRQDPVGALAVSRLIMETPALCARSQEKQNGWRPALAQALAERDRRPGRDGAPQPTALGPSVRAAAALNCLNIAVDHWTASGGRLDLDDLLDEAFAALTPQ